MKRNLKTLLIAAFLITTPLFIFAQPPLPGDIPPEGTEVGGNGVGAPLGNGTFILLTLAAAFAIRKAYVLREEKEEEKE